VSILKRKGKWEKEKGKKKKRGFEDSSEGRGRPPCLPFFVVVFD